MSAAEKEIAELEELLNLEAITIRIEIGDKTYTVSEVLRKGWRDLYVDPKVYILGVATALGGATLQTVAGHFTPEVIEDADPPASGTDG